MLVPGSWSIAYDINNAGQVVGRADAGSGQHAFLWSGGVTTDLGTFPGSSVSSAHAINSAGTVAGFSHTASGQVHAFAYSGGTMKDLGTLTGHTSSDGRGINSAGTIVGKSDNLGSEAVAWAGGSITQLPALGTPPLGGGTEAWAINASGTVVGRSGLRAFSYAAGVTTDLGTLPGGTLARAFSINDQGGIVGEANDSTGGPFAVRWASGTINRLGDFPNTTASVALDVNASDLAVGNWLATGGAWRAALWGPTGIVDLNTEIPAGSGWILESAHAINDSGWIVGNGYHNNAYRGFVLVPATDATPPSISCGSADGLWHGANVSIACRASDSGTGLADPADASFSLSTSVAADSEDANAPTGTRSVCDKAGNCATAGPVGGNKVDRKAPSTAIAVPAKTTYVLGSVHHSSYTCADGGSGLASCAGTVVNGVAIDTSTAGMHSFAVTATDAVGNASTQTVLYEVVATNWAQFRYGPERHGVQADEYLLDPSNVASLKPDWAKPTGASVLSSPAVVDGVVYVGSMNGDLSAFSASSGTLLWSSQTGGSVYSSPAVHDGRVFVGSMDGRLYAFEASSGALLWSFATADRIEASPAVAHGLVYIGSIDTTLYALDEKSGALVWSQTLAYPLWSSVAIDGDTVYAGSGDFHAFDALTGKTIWSTWLPTSCVSTPATLYGLVFVGCDDGVLYALEGSQGQVVWTATTGAAIVSSPAVDRKLVYVGSNDGRVYAFEAGSGATVWATYLGGGWVTSSPAYANGVVYVGSSAGTVNALEAGSGALLWSYATMSNVNSSPAIADGTVFIGSDDTRLYAFR